MVEVARQNMAPKVKTWMGHRFEGHCRSTTDARPCEMAASRAFMLAVLCCSSLRDRI